VLWVRATVGLVDEGYFIAEAVSGFVFILADLESAPASLFIGALFRLKYVSVHKASLGVEVNVAHACAIPVA